MRTKTFLPSLARASGMSAVALALATGTTLHAQSPGIGASAHIGAGLPSSTLDVEEMNGWGGRLLFEPSPYARIGVGASFYDDTYAGSREARMWMPSVDLEGHLAGDKVRLYGTLSPSLMIFSLAETPGAPAERVKVPSLGAGVTLSAKVLGPFSLEISARDWVTWTRPMTVLTGGEGRGAREIGHSPEISAQLSFTWRKKPRRAAFEALPMSFTGNFRPVSAPEVQDPHLSLTKGRTHAHVKEGERHLDAPYHLTQLVEDQLIGTIEFAAGAYEIDRDGQQIVREIARSMQENPNMKIRIKGYTSPEGPLRMNLTLAERRTMSIADQLIYFYEIDADRIDTMTGGVDPEFSKKGRARRAEIHTLKVVRTR